jgi:hypothetical protein
MRTVLNSQIKGGPGAISSSRCQTTRALPGKPGRARNPFTCGRAKQAVASAAFDSPHAHLAATAATKFRAGGLTRNGCRHLKLRNRRHHAPTTKPARAAERRTPPSGPRRRIADRRSGGARRDRTDDLLLAKQALSQLSYGPFRYQGSVIRDQGSPNS